MTRIAPIKAVIPRTKPIFATLDPTTLLIAIEGDPFKAAFKLTKSSGSDVAKETTVKPITIFEILNLRDNATEARTKKSPPITSKTNPNNIKITSISFF